MMILNSPINENQKNSPHGNRQLEESHFMNCDPLFLQLSEEWNVLAAPPSWLTGHLLRKDCIIAPIPAADYAKNSHELILLPDLGICSKGEVGSVLLFGSKPI